VNPRDVEAMKNVMIQAIRMPEKDAKWRMVVLRTQVRRHDVFDWSSEFMERLQR